MQVLLERSEGIKAHAIAEAELALSQLEEARAALDPLLLAPEEVEALALGSCWLARYWGLAAAFGIHLEVSEAAAERWREVAPPPSAMLDAARRAATAATRRGGRSGGGGGSGGGGSAASSSRGGVSRCETEGGASTTSGGDQQQQQQHQLAAWWIHQRRQQQQQDDRRRRQRSDGGGGGGAVRRPDGDGGARGLLLEEASAADAADVDLALRQLAELGVEAEVMGALAEQARARRAVVQLPQAGAAPEGLTPVALGPEEAEEVRFQAARLLYLWASAAAAGVEAPLSGERAEYWAWRLARGRETLRDFTDLRHGFQELRLRGVEQLLWDARRAAAAAAAEEARADGALS
ncbi:hypothetical protein MNEG_8115 [Monoraphidium neglectum]|uniref:Uncharacterized protein n=1 Tax=Monoraphidium neglectum TaxID=145388 RepID=A0A0D2M974_9CHLO|nr:hypothetical protein MNEG_8115 [Monoraphidium neglectum]KIY99844.1 hypothetical protein MNEG_8115 [Monoraphidium neglectum]|eukprot:XP_013898864.1 hypothetical protein MNEG_8115 [Monoraphidium neglectum]